MCGRYTLASPNPSMLRERFGLGEEIEVRQRFNVAPTDEVVTVTTTKEGAPRPDLLRWGLVPFWSKDPSTGYKMINARAETLADRPAFRDALDTRRCLIVADGFYEWQRRPDGPKQPYWITRDDHEPFAFAGLWAIWRPPGEDSEPLRTCTIITTAANDAVAELHDRMPVILTPDAESAWLSHDVSRDEALGLLKPLPSGAVDMRPVSRAVNDVKNDSPECLEPPDEPPPTLF